MEFQLTVFSNEHRIWDKLSFGSHAVESWHDFVEALCRVMVSANDCLGPLAHVRVNDVLLEDTFNVIAVWSVRLRTYHVFNDFLFDRYLKGARSVRLRLLTTQLTKEDTVDAA